jgi:ribonuclease R
VSPRTALAADGRTGEAGRVAVLERRGKFLVAEPFFGPGQRFTVSRDKRADIGDLVLLRADSIRGGRGGRASIARRIGKPTIARDVIEALMIDRGLKRSFDPAVEHDARDAVAVRESSLGGDGGPRRDLRDLPTFTIDPATARDYDDAISCTAEGDAQWRVWVHIADVSAFVPPRSLIDREAYRRGTSVYVPGAVEPMLPRALSNDACSLVPAQDRLTVTVEMVVTGDEVSPASCYRSVIRSDERLNYEQVDRIFDGTERAAEPWGESLAAARACAAVLAARRAARSALRLEGGEEPEFEFDRAGNIVGFAPVRATESHGLIEQLMIAANEQVARVLEEKHVPALYRVHERPEAAAVERLIDQLASLDVPTPPVPSGHMTPQQTGVLIGEASALVAEWVSSHDGRGARALNRLVLRTLKQAYYDSRNLGHSGLQSPRYCHFTSPIRRYPDLICHRSLLAAVAGVGPAPDASWVTAAGPWTSTREREAMIIERDADDIARCFLLERSLRSLGGDAVFEGEVVGLIGAGAFVSFGETAAGAFEGLLPVRKLDGDWWELNEQGTVLVGTRNGGAIRLGDPVSVRVERVDTARGRVDLVPAMGED